MKPTFIALLMCLCLPLAGADKGKPLPKDFKSLKALAEKGDVRAQFELGQAYRRGKGVPKDNGKAAKWYHMAAEKGSVDGSYYLGVMYFNGDGVEKDMIRAYINLSIAAQKKNAKAISVKELVVKAMTPKQILTGDALLKAPERRTHFKFQPDCMAALIKSVGLNWVKKHPVGFEVDDPKGSMIDFVDKDSGLRASWATVKLANGDELYISSAGGILIKDGRNAAFAKQVFRANVKDSTRVAINLHQNQAKGYQTPFGMTDFLLTVFTQTALQSDSRKQYLERLNRIAGVAVKEAMPLPKDFKLVEALAEKGDVKAQLALGRAYANGEQVKKNDKEAVKWFRKAAGQGDSYGQYLIALAYAEGKGVLRNDIEAIKWYRKAANQGLADAQFNLGECLNLGRGVKKDPKEAAVWLLKAANQGYAGAQDNLGLMYAQGVGVKRDFKEALKWLRKSAEQGHSHGQLNLGNMYASGAGVPPDFVTAYAWWIIAASNGLAEAKRLKPLLADKMNPEQVAKAQKLSKTMLRLNPKLVSRKPPPEKKPLPKGLELTKDSAEKGNVNSQYFLGLSYSLGRDGLERDYVQAAKWYRKAALQGNVDAMDQLALIYKRGGFGLKANIAESTKWIRKSAEQGSVNGQALLGAIYLEGNGVNRDLVKAYAWSDVAAANGNAVARNIKDAAAKRMTQKQIFEAKELSRELLKKIGANRK